MRPGIIIQHGKEEAVETGIVRNDVTGFIGVVPKNRWPRGATEGDFLEVPIKSFSDLVNSKLKVYFDPVTVRAVQSFYENGGQVAVLFGLCVESEESLLVEDPFATLFHPILDRLRGQEDIAILIMPILAYLPVQYQSKGQVVVRCEPVLKLLLEHCREMNNRFLIMDVPRDLHDAPLIRWVTGFRERVAPAAAYGALYYPWLQSGDEVFPPAGAMGGIFARTEREHEPFGVRWPPANQIIRGVTHPHYEVKWSETETLSQLGINPILTQPARGVVIWGARTLSKDPRWMHINSRRIVSFIAEQLRRDSEWVVFEHQRPELWHIIRRMVTSRLDSFWGAGLLTGDQAGSEYLVQCDQENNPTEVRDAGQVNIKVVLRPISTAEYIVVDLRLGAEGLG